MVAEPVCPFVRSFIHLHTHTHTVGNGGENGPVIYNIIHAHHQDPSHSSTLLVSESILQFSKQDVQWRTGIINSTIYISCWCFIQNYSNLFLSRLLLLALVHWSNGGTHQKWKVCCITNSEYSTETFTTAITIVVLLV